MITTIPRLSDLIYTRNPYGIAGAIAVRFVKLHEEDWQLAQAHWNEIVARVLNTDAVHPNASGATAMYQAVTATARLLDRTDLRDRCPRCPANSEGRAA
jgi:lysophospholipase L1-like esterase